MPMPSILQLPNLLSLSRVALAPIVGYLLYVDTPETTAWCVILFVVAGLTDWLDGLVARMFGQVSRLGIALDPIADKIFVGIVIICLVLFRALPIWLAMIIVGRDLLILIAGGILLGGQNVVVPSNHWGKYAFASIAVLLASYTIRFPFGMWLMTIIALILIVASLVSYTRVFLLIKQGRKDTAKDKRVYQVLRYAATLIISIIFIYKLLQFWFRW
jgi:cardiolipin synthase